MANQGIGLSVEFDAYTVDQALKELRLVAVRKVTRQAINASLRPELLKIKRQVATAAKVPVKALKSRPKFVKAKGDYVSAVIYFKEHPVGYPSVPVTPLARGGVRLGRHYRFDKAFLTKVRRTGQEQYFQRRGESRYPIDRIGVELKPHVRSALAAASKRATRNFKRVHFPEYFGRERERIFAKANAKQRAKG